jgi:HSP20 family protein
MLAWSWQDFDDMVRLLERDVWGRFGRTMPSASEGNGRRRLVPAIDVLRKDGELAIRFELSGVDPEKVDVSMDGNVLRVRAERDEGLAEGVQIVRREIPYGTYERRITLPDGVDPDRLAARFTNGLLEIVVPFEERRAVKVPVQIAEGEQPQELVEGDREKELAGTTS